MQLPKHKSQLQRFRNALHSIIIIGSMLILLGFTSWLVLGETSWWIVLILLVTLIVGLSTSPRFILRLYRAEKIPPHSALTLYNLVSHLSERATLEKTPDLYYIPSSAPIAFTTGYGDETVIAISDGLLHQLNLREIAGALAHEISHIRHNDIWVMSIADSVTRTTSITCIVGLLFLIPFTPYFIFGDFDIPWLGILLLAIIPHITTLLQFGLSRTREFEADLGAVTLTEDPIGMISTLQKLDGRNFSWLSRILLPRREDPTPSFLRTHPPIEARIERLKQLIKQSPQPDFSDQQYIPGHIIRVNRQPKRHWNGLWY